MATRIHGQGAVGGALEAGSRPWVCVAVLAGVCLARGVPAAATDVLAGIDLWQTVPGTTFSDAFNPGAGGTPIPADFFYPGSDPFTGSIALDGQPLPALGGPCPFADTIVERLADASLPVCPSSDTIPIQIVALSLSSASPITVTGTMAPQAWDVRVCLSDLPQPVGTMTIDHLCPDGGTYTSSLPVLAKFIFSEVGNPTNERVFDTGIEGIAPEFLGAFDSWVHEDRLPDLVIRVGPGVIVDANCDGTPEPPLAVGTSNFIPGVFLFPCDCGTPPGGSSQQKKLTLEQALLVSHGVIPAQAGDDDGDGVPDDGHPYGCAKPAFVKWSQRPHGLVDCCVDHATPGCEIPACEALICGFDPFCCGAAGAWDSICVDEAEDLCGICNTTGFNVPSDLDWQTLSSVPPGNPGPGPNWVVADDFISDGRPITCVHWWGSYVDPAFEPELAKECGPPGTCATGFTDCGTPPAGEVCVCATRPDGTGACHQSVDCAGLVECPGGDSDCPPDGSKCFVDTCCGAPICAWNCGEAPPGASRAGAADPAEVLTTSGKRRVPEAGTVERTPAPGHGGAANAATEARPGAAEPAMTVAAATSSDTETRGPVDCVDPGEDCWATQCGATKADFSVNPLPADFFQTGSQPFGGVIQLQGSSGGFGPDTVIERLDQLCFRDPLPSTDTVDIEIVALDLVSCAPITVQDSGGTEQWNVHVGLSELQTSGWITATKVDANGGTFTTQLFVWARYTFSRVEDPADTRVFDTFSEGLNPLILDSVGEASWSTDESFDFCSPGDGFAPGFSHAPSRGAGTGDLCCEETCHGTAGDPTPCDPSAGHCHCTTPPKCPRCSPPPPPPGTEVDGWLISFHSDLSADQSPTGFSMPLDLLGLYFCAADVIDIGPTEVFGWDYHRVYDYFVELEDCCLVHSNEDVRKSDCCVEHLTPGCREPACEASVCSIDPFCCDSFWDFACAQEALADPACLCHDGPLFPAQPDAFYENECSIYWLDIQAVVGHTYANARVDLFGSEPIGGGGGGSSQIWDITVPGGPDALIGPPVHPIAALSGLANCGGSIVGVTGNGGGGSVHTFTFAGALTGSRAPTDPAITAMAGASTAPPVAAGLGFTPGHVYTTASTGLFGPPPSVTDSLYDIGPCGAGPDVAIGPLADAGGFAIGGIDGLAFDPLTGTLYGSTGFFAYGAPHLVTIDATGLVTDLGPLLVGGVTPVTVAGLAFSEGSLYGSLGGGVGDIIVIPPGAPGAAFFDHAVTGGSGSIAGLTHQDAPDVWEEIPTYNRAEDHFWGWHTSPKEWNDESVMGVVMMGANGEWIYDDWMVVDGTPHMLPRVDQAFELLTNTNGGPDCNSNGVPDECEPDCNATGVPDDCDIAAGASLDCNATGVPDECEAIDGGDWDADGDVDLDDHKAFVECLAGPNVPPSPPLPACIPACLAAFDFNNDSDVDLQDWKEFILLIP